MVDSLARKHFSDRLTSRSGAWAALAAAVVFIVLAMGLFSGASVPSGHNQAPAASESARAAALAATFPNADEQSLIVVASRPDSTRLTTTDIAALNALRPSLDRETGHRSAEPQISADGRAAVIVTPVSVPTDTGENAAAIKHLRAAIADHTPRGLDLQVTGGPAFAADITSAFDGANFALLAVTIAIVAILLIVTYRSPILWLLPLAVVAVADQVAGMLTAAVGEALGLEFDSGIISVLVFGAGTNYALLMISRYREELVARTDQRSAIGAAWRKTAPAIIASNFTVVIALSTLTLAVIPGTRGLGIAAAVGLLVALAAVLLVLPPLLAVSGRKVFWPFIPRVGSMLRQGRLWGSIATRVMRRPWAGLAAGLVLLAVMGAGLFGASVGLNQAQQFRGNPQSAVGLTTLSKHFPAGKADPIIIFARTGEAGQVAAKARGVAGVVRTSVIGASTDGSLTKIMVTGAYTPGSAESRRLVADLRGAVHTVSGADALVGGSVANEVDARAGNEHDLVLVAPIILVISLGILMILLRALLAPVLLLLVNVASATAAIGAGSWLSRVVFGEPALDVQVPLLAFLFLVALGIDYTIFLVHRARIETREHGTRAGMVRALVHTGGVITSAGVVLAAVFAALGVLPLVVLGQLGLIVGVGVLVDTLVVRTVIVPSLFGILGERIWWPSPGPAVRREESTGKGTVPNHEIPVATAG